MIFGQDLCPTLSKGEGLPTSNLDLPHEEDPDADQKDHRKPGDENVLPERGVFFFLRVDHHMFFSEELDHLRVFRSIGFISSVFRILPGDVSALGFDLEDLAVFNGRDEIRGIFFCDRLAGFVEEVEEKDHDDNDDGPEEKILVEGIQITRLLKMEFLNSKTNMIPSSFQGITFCLIEVNLLKSLIKK